jgi:hypothetical protein
LTPPRAFQALRVSSHRALNSAGSRLNAASGPPSARARVKCFSTAQAPRDTAATEAAVPGVWSDRPIGQPNRAAMSTMVRTLASSKLAG